MLALELWVRPEDSVMRRNGAWKQEAYRGERQVELDICCRG